MRYRAPTFKRTINVFFSPCGTKVPRSLTFASDVDVAHASDPIGPDRKALIVRSSTCGKSRLSGCDQRGLPDATWRPRDRLSSSA